MSHVINVKTGLVYAATRLLLNHKNFMVCNGEIEAHIQEGVGQFKIVEKADGTGYNAYPVVNGVAPEVAAAPEPEVGPGVEKLLETANPVDATTVTVEEPASEPQSSEGLAVPEDFDLNVDVSSMGKPHLLGVASRIEGLMYSERMGVVELRNLVSAALEQLKSGS